MRLRVRYCVLLLAGVVALVGCGKSEIELSGTAKSQTLKVLNLRGQAVAIVKQPQYMGTPDYALLVFGKNAETQTWLVVDETTVYLDRNGDGDLTTPAEKILLDEGETAKMKANDCGEIAGSNVFDLGNIAGHDFVLSVWVLNRSFRPDPNEDEMRTTHRQMRLKNGWTQATLFRGRVQIPLMLCEAPEHAQISHIAGPLTYDLKWGDRQKLERGDRTSFDIHIGTPGLATRNSPYSVFSNLSIDEVPKNIAPMAVFTFLNREEGGDPVQLTVNLDRRC